VRAVIRRVLVLLLAVVTLTGCGVPLDDAPRDITGARLPARSGAPVPDGAGRAAERLCFVRDSRLVRIVRRVPVARPPAAQLADLLAGPTAGESADGLTSALTTASHVTMKLTAGRATVDIGDRTGQALRSDDVIAFGQIVCTLTAQLPVGTVAFTSGGEPLSVPRADGSLASGRLTIADYVDLLE
jgi:spore germination protein GerM